MRQRFGGQLLGKVFRFQLVVVFAIDYFRAFPLSFHGSFLLQVTVVGNVGDVLRVLLDSQRFGIVSDLCDFPFLLLKVRVVFDIGLNFGVLCYPLQFRRFCDGGCFGFWDVCFAVWKFVETFVCFHVQCHTALGTFEACFVPCLIQAFQLLDGIYHLLTPGAGFIHFDSLVVVVVVVEQAQISSLLSLPAVNSCAHTTFHTHNNRNYLEKAFTEAETAPFFDYVSTAGSTLTHVRTHTHTHKLFSASSRTKFLFR